MIALFACAEVSQTLSHLESNQTVTTTTTVRPAINGCTNLVTLDTPEFTTIRPTRRQRALNHYSHNSAKNATTIRPVTADHALELFAQVESSMGKQNERLSKHCYPDAPRYIVDAPSAELSLAGCVPTEPISFRPAQPA